MKDRDIHAAIRILRREVPKWETPIVTLMAKTYGSPFRVLISCILSLRTQDSTTAQASHRLFALADSPQEMLKLTAKKIEKAIYPVGFYRTKAKVIRDICQVLMRDYSGRVPDEIDELLKLKGVGRKTANLVLGLCQNHDAREDRVCPQGKTSETVLDRIQRSPGFIRPAPLPADFTVVQPMSRWEVLRQGGCHPQPLIVAAPIDSRCLLN